MNELYPGCLCQVEIDGKWKNVVWEKHSPYPNPRVLPLDGSQLQLDNWFHKITSDTFLKDKFKLKLLSRERIKLEAAGITIYNGICKDVNTLKTITDAYMFNQMNILGYRTYRYSGPIPEVKGLKIKRLSNYPRLIFVL